MVCQADHNNLHYSHDPDNRFDDYLRDLGREEMKTILKQYADMRAEQHYEAKQMSIKALEQTRWISVNERLPEEGLTVLTYGENGDYEVNWLDFDGKWFWEDVDVVAWMPLPPCYKPQESEE